MPAISIVLVCMAFSSGFIFFIQRALAQTGFIVGSLWNQLPGRALFRIIHHRDCGRTGDGHVALASKDITLGMEEPDLVRARAETLFNRKEKQEKQRLEGEQAMAEYVAEKQAMREKTARLRALRLARDAAKEAAARSRKRVG
jgi:hypothetical protein